MRQHVVSLQMNTQCPHACHVPMQPSIMQDLDPTKVYRHHVAISHTRWATHGPPSAVNSHPHVSDDAGEFVVVHNGIITNYQALKDILVSGLGWDCAMLRC